MYEVLDSVFTSCEYCERIKCAYEMMVVNTSEYPETQSNYTSIMSIRVYTVYVHIV